jgi:hypothetical protein
MQKKTSLTILKLAVAAIAICLSVSSASAQSLNASFTLPFEVHWGRAVLPAGSYTITFDSVHRPAIVRAGREGRAIVMPVTVNEAVNDQPSALILTRSENGYDVRYLNLREENLSLGYHLFNESERRVVRGADKPEALAVLTTQK